MDGNLAALEGRDLVRIDVETDDVVADLREAGAGDEPDVTRPDHRNPHRAPSRLRSIAASAVGGSFAWVMGRPITR